MNHNQEYLDNLPSIRIIKIDGSEITYSKKTNKPLNINNVSEVFDSHFSDIMPPSLDLIFLAENNKLSLKEFKDELFSYDLVNVSFKETLILNKKKERVYKKSKTTLTIQTAEIRKDLYLNGFTLNNEKYVRYKRSAGAAKSGSCLFIKEKLYSLMNKWSKAGLDEAKDNCFNNLTSYEAYKALSLSSLISTLRLNPYNILFVKDKEVIVPKQKVLRVYYEDKKGLSALEEECDIKNNIFDGEGLLDKSVFINNNLSKKGMMLLRNRYFKCCAFNTNLQDWFKANNIKSVNQLNGYTFAKDIKDILLVVSESCLKYFKLSKEGYSLESIKRWCDSISKDNSSLFGIVKTDKGTRFFNGDMVETTYQLLNTLQLKQSEVRKLVLPYIDYYKKIRDIKNTPEFIRFYFEGELNETDIDNEDDSELTYEEKILNHSSYLFKNKVCLDLAKIDENVKYTTLFKKRVYENVISNLALRLYRGRTLVDGTYATLFGNPFEYLNYIISKDNDEKFNALLSNPILKENEIYCSFFNNEEKVVGSRAPHTTMGNILLATNKRVKEIDNWFNLTRNIVVVDAIRNNIQHRLSGCDYDSDTMLLTNNEIIVNSASLNYDKFFVPYGDLDNCKTKKQLENLSKDKKENIILNLNKLDKAIAENNVGTIVNKSQLLNSHLWDKYNQSKYFDYSTLYSKIAILSVLSGVEIDNAKRSFLFSTTKELARISKYMKANGFDDSKPMFFANVASNKDRKLKIGEIEDAIKSGSYFKTTMDYIWKIVRETDIDADNIPTTSFSSLVCKDFKTKGISKREYDQVETAIKALEETRTILYKNNIARKNSQNYEADKKNFVIDIKNCLNKIKTCINSIKKIKLLINKIELEKLSHSLLYILLYILIINEKETGISLRSLFPSNVKGMKTLRKTNIGEKYQYTIFNRYHYTIDEIDALISNIFF